MKKIVFCIALALASSSALADTNTYIGTYIGTSHSSQLSSGSTVEGYIGHEWTSGSEATVGVEVGYEQYPGIQFVGGNAYAYKLDGVITNYFDNAQTFGIFGFLGINDSGASGVGSSFGFDTGLGLRYNIARNFDLRLRAQYVRLGSNSGLGYNIDEDNISLGLAYHFN